MGTPGGSTAGLGSAVPEEGLSGAADGILAPDAAHF